MSIFRLFFDNDLFQRQDINRLQERASRIEGRYMSERSRNQDLEAELAELRHDVARLYLVVDAVARTVIEKGVTSKEDFAAMITTIDDEDGTPDGLSTPKAQGGRRRSCGHPVGRKGRPCALCGKVDR